MILHNQYLSPPGQKCKKLAFPYEPESARLRARYQSGRIRQPIVLDIREDRQPVVLDAQRVQAASGAGGPPVRRRSYILTSSTRRFVWRPSGVSLLAAGFVSPRPADCRREPSMP
jgi:hypothetical protein